MKSNKTSKEQAAIEVLKSTGVDILEAALVAKTAIAAGRGRIKRALKCLEAGAESLKQQERTVSFEKAVAAALEARRERRRRICPPGWLRHWRELRRAAGWTTREHPWPQDALRHTYASYHLSYFRSYAELQVEIGHRDATLLRTRYVDQRGVVNAGKFWRPYRKQPA